MEENDLDLIEKHVCAAYDPHNRFYTKTLTGWGSFYLQSRVTTGDEVPATRDPLQLHILRSGCACGWIWV